MFSLPFFPLSDLSSRFLHEVILRTQDLSPGPPMALPSSRVSLISHSTSSPNHLVHLFCRSLPSLPFLFPLALIPLFNGFWIFQTRPQPPCSPGIKSSSLPNDPLTPFAFCLFFSTHYSFISDFLGPPFPLLKYLPPCPKFP